MEGDRKLILHRPGPVLVSASGEEVTGDSIDYVVWARRIDRGGSESLQADTQIGTWQSRFEIRRVDRWKDVDASWSLTDENGRVYDIESVAEGMGAKHRWLWVYGTARTTPR